MTTSLERLQQHVRVGGPAETPCNFLGASWHKLAAKQSLDALGCPACHGADVIVSPEILAIREALWRHRGDTFKRTIAEEYVPRSRAEAALLLPAALKAIGMDVQIQTVGLGGWEASVLLISKEEVGLASNLADAISVAVLAWLEEIA